MKYSRLAVIVALSASLTSCQTLGGLMNCSPVRLFDQTASSLLGYLAENEESPNGGLESIQDRARKVESRGIYAGQTPVEGSSRQNMAAR